MRNGKYDVLSPLYSGEPVNEAEVPGRPSGCGCTPLHRDAPLHTLPDLLLPVIKHRQYVVATEQGRPVFFMSGPAQPGGRGAFSYAAGNSYASVGLEQWRPDVGL